MPRHVLIRSSTAPPQNTNTTGSRGRRAVMSIDGGDDLDKLVARLPAAGDAEHPVAGRQRPRRPALAVVHTRRSPVTRRRAGPRASEPGSRRPRAERGEDIGPLVGFLRPSMTGCPPARAAGAGVWLVPPAADVDHDDRAALSTADSTGQWAARPCPAGHDILSLSGRPEIVVAGCNGEVPVPAPAQR